MCLGSLNVMKCGKKINEAVSYYLYPKYFYEISYMYFYFLIIFLLDQKYMYLHPWFARGSTQNVVNFYYGIPYRNLLKIAKFSHFPLFVAFLTYVPGYFFFF